MNKIPSIKHLRQTGHKVRIERFRPYPIGESFLLLDDNNARMNGLTKADVYQCGGVTIASVRSPNGREVKGVSECSLTDPFVKKAGVEIAIARALDMEVPAH